MDLDRLVYNILGREVSLYGVSRIPFWFGSRKSCGFNIRDFVTEDNPLLNIGEKGFKFWKLIRLNINPNQLTLTPFIRIPEAKTGAGRVYYNWVNEKGSAIEAYEVNMRGVTGNLLPGNSEAKRRLYIWMQLRELTLEPRMIKTTVVTRYNSIGEPIESTQQDVVNEAFILARTVGLPTAVLFIGFFKTPIVFAERADSQYNHEWNFTFAVTDMYPRYEELSKYTTFSIIPEVVSNILRL